MRHHLHNLLSLIAADKPWIARLISVHSPHPRSIDYASIGSGFSIRFSEPVSVRRIAAEAVDSVQ